jgi:hypothetical protein
VAAGEGVLLGTIVAVAKGMDVLMGDKVAVAAGRVSVGRKGLLGDCIFVTTGVNDVVLLEVGSRPIAKVPLQAVMNRRMRTAGTVRNFIEASCLD